jgi:long-chain acyl-CoA synthetase
VGKLSDGTLFAPKYLENKLKFFPHIKEAVAFGDGKAEATAMINIDVQAVGDWASGAAFHIRATPTSRPSPR